MKTLSLFRAAGLALVLTGLANGPALAGDSAQAQYEDMYQQAKAAQKRAASVEGEWRDIGKFLKKAQALAKKGDYEAAFKLARKAYIQGKLGYTQALSQQKVDWPSYFK